MASTGPTDIRTSTLIASIERVDLRVQEIDRAVRFYRDIIGLEVAGQDEHRATLGSGDAHVLVTLDSAGVTAPVDKRATGLFHTAFRFPDRASLGDGLARLVGAGYEIGAGDHGVSEALYVDDPDGNGVELYRDRPRDMWPKPAPGERVGMYSARVDLDDLLNDRNAGPEARPVAPVVGHVHLQVGDLLNTERFYVDGLALDLMQIMAGSAIFVSSHGYHHHLAANVWNSRGGSPARPNHAGLQRVVFRASSPADLEHATRRLRERGYETSGDGSELVVRDPDEIELRFVV